MLLIIDLTNRDAIKRAMGRLKARLIILECLEEVEDQSIDDLELTYRSANCLKFAKILTVEQLCTMTARELLTIPNLGKRSLKDIEDSLGVRGLRLAALRTTIGAYIDLNI